MPPVNTAARRRTRLAPARRRAHRRPELEVLHPLGRQARCEHRTSAQLSWRHCAPDSTARADRPVAAHRPELACSRTQQLLRRRKQGGIDVYFVGDSITRRWGATDYPDLLANWKAELLRLERGGLRLGRRPDENILWRLENGELDGVNPKVIVLLAGTNNVGTQPRR